MAKHLDPSFIIMGGVKCGTSSLYRYLNAHPLVLPCKSKEPNYFSFRPWYQIPFSYGRYKKMFPLKNAEGEIKADWLDLGEDEKMHASHFVKIAETGKNYITGEATATTFFAASPRLIKFLLPNLKLIMLMRDPIERYVSHYRMYQRFKQEGRQGYDFKPLPEYIDDEIEAFHQGKKTRILHQGLYTTYLQKWEEVFGREKLLLLRTLDFEEVGLAQHEMEKVCEFLGLTEYNFREALGERYNQAQTQEIAPKVSEKLRKFYADSLEELRLRYQIKL
ncbi:MAG: sulfotransferase [Bacteroidia bacterium]|nr:sulfotransferase [Bacteroidia bacterium]